MPAKETPPLLQRKAGKSPSSPAADRFVKSGSTAAPASKRRVQTYLTKETFKQLAIVCAEEDLAWADAIELAVEEWLKKKRP